MAMSSKERVRAMFQHRQPDCVPIDYSCNPDIDRRLKEHFGLAANDVSGLRRRLGVDFAGVWPNYAGPKLHPEPPGFSVDQTTGIRRRWIEHASGGYWDVADWPLAEADLATVEAWPLSSPDHYDYDGLVRQCQKLGEFAVYLGGAGIGDIINNTGCLRRMDQLLMDLATDEPAGLRLIDRRLEVQLGVWRRSLEAARGLIDFAFIGEDLGSQRGPILSLALFNRHIRPRLQKFVDVAKQHSLPVMIHSCGSSSWAFDSFIEMGIAAVDTLQPEAKDMAPGYLKRRWGSRLAFHGGISTAGPLAYGTPQQVVQNVREVLAVMMPGGGYALAPTHQIQDNSPTENVLAMYEAAQEFGKY
jgi:uroporphyrinogen decarboxylase